jgi:hypothetical protein
MVADRTAKRFSKQITNNVTTRQHHEFYIIIIITIITTTITINPIIIEVSASDQDRILNPLYSNNESFTVTVFCRL